MSASGILADLALRISTNTSELTVGLDKAKNGINKFSKEAQERTKKVGEGFNSLKEGVANMAGGIQGKLSEVTGGISEMASSIPAVITGIKGMTAGMNLFKVALAGTGIGLLVIALASLIAYFMNTKEGADMLSKAMAGIKAVVGVVIDTFANFGGVIIKAIKDPIGTLKSFGDAIKNFVTSKIEQLMSGIKGLGTALKLLFAGEFKKAAQVAVTSAKDIVSATNPIVWGLEGVGAAVNGVKKKYGEASKEAKKAIQLEGDAQKLRDRQLAFSVEESKQQVRIAELKKKTSEEDKYSAAERLKFLDEMKRLETGLASKRVSFAKEQLRIQQGINSLSNKKSDTEKTTLELQVQVNAQLKEQQDKLEELAGKRVSILSQQKSEVAEQQKLNKERKEELQIQKEYNALKKSDLGSLNTKQTVEFKPKVEKKDFEVRGVAVTEFQVKGIDTEKLRAKLQPIQDEYVTMMDAAAAQTSDMMNDAFTNAIAGFAEALGAIAAGDSGGLKTFLNGMLMMVIDFASQFGKLLISIGTAKIALEKIGISGIGAVIAGGALIALTSMASSFLAKGIDKKANGGISKGGLTLVGERGPELVNLPKDANVTRANKTERLLKGNNNVNVTGHMQLSGEMIHIALEEYKRRNGNRY